MDYTARIQDYQIRDVTYIPGYEPSTSRPQKFDIVKWYYTEPSINLITGEKVGLRAPHCYSIGCLIWNSKERDFEFHSIGMRWFEEDVPVEFCHVVKAFADFKAAEYRSLENECNN